MLKDNKILGVVTEKGDKVLGKSVILATGHSARDIFFLLQENIAIEAALLWEYVLNTHKHLLIQIHNTY